MGTRVGTKEREQGDAEKHTTLQALTLRFFDHLGLGKFSTPLYQQPLFLLFRVLFISSPSTFVLSLHVPCFPLSSRKVEVLRGEAFSSREDHRGTASFEAPNSLNCYSIKRASVGLPLCLKSHRIPSTKKNS